MHSDKLNADIQQAEHEKNREKQAAWSRLKIADPFLCEFLNAFSKTFGKPKRLLIEIENIVIYKS